jgi:glutathione S-transferase
VGRHRHLEVVHARRSNRGQHQHYGSKSLHGSFSLISFPETTLSTPSNTFPVVALAFCFVACAEKAQWAFYEGRVRSAEKVHTPWIEHSEKQVLGGFEHLNIAASKIDDCGWIAGTPKISQADVTATVAYTFAKTVRPKLELVERFPELSRFARHCENLPAFLKTPVPQAPH